MRRTANSPASKHLIWSFPCHPDQQKSLSKVSNSISVHLSKTKTVLTLKRQSNRKIFLIVDLHPVRHSQKTQKCIDKHAAKIRLIYVPAYRPDLNPNLPVRYTQTSEMLNHDVTSNAALPVPVERQTGRKKRPPTLQNMIDNVRAYPRRRQRRKAAVRR